MVTGEFVASITLYNVPLDAYQAAPKEWRERFERGLGDSAPDREHSPSYDMAKAMRAYFLYGGKNVPPGTKTPVKKPKAVKKARHPVIDAQTAIAEGLEAIIAEEEPAIPTEPSLDVPRHYHAEPGQLSRPDLVGKPQYVPVDEIEQPIPSSFQRAAEEAAIWTESENQLDRRTSSLSAIGDVGTYNSQTIRVPKNSKHNDPLKSAQYTEDIVPMIERELESMPQRKQ